MGLATELDKVQFQGDLTEAWETVLPALTASIERLRRRLGRAEIDID